METPPLLDDSTALRSSPPSTAKKSKKAASSPNKFPSPATNATAIDSIAEVTESVKRSSLNKACDASTSTADLTTSSSPNYPSDSSSGKTKTTVSAESIRKTNRLVERERVLLPGEVTGKKREDLLRAMPPKFGEWNSYSKHNGFPQYPGQAHQNALNMHPADFDKLYTDKYESTRASNFQLEQEALVHDLVQMGILNPDGTRKIPESTPDNVAASNAYITNTVNGKPSAIAATKATSDSILSRISPYKKAEHDAFAKLVTEGSRPYEAAGVFFNVKDKTIMPRAFVELMNIASRGHKLHEHPSLCEPHIAMAEIIWDLTQSGKTVSYSRFGIDSFKRSKILKPDFQPNPTWFTEVAARLSMQVPDRQPGDPGYIYPTTVAPAPISSPSIDGSTSASHSDTESTTNETDSLNDISFAPTTTATANQVAPIVASKVGDSPTAPSATAVSTPLTPASAIKPTASPIELPRYIPPPKPVPSVSDMKNSSIKADGPAKTPSTNKQSKAFTPESSGSSGKKRAHDGSDMPSTSKKSRSSSGGSDYSGSSGRKRASVDALEPFSGKRTKLTKAIPTSIEETPLRRSSRTHRRGSLVYDDHVFDFSSEDELSPLKKKSSVPSGSFDFNPLSSKNKKLLATDDNPITPQKSGHNLDGFATPPTSGKKEKKIPVATIPKSYVGVPSQHGYPVNPPPNAELTTPWQCSDSTCASGMTWLRREKKNSKKGSKNDINVKDEIDGKTDRDDNTQSVGRKMISQYFGRNKEETDRIPGDVWNFQCRKHYQRDKYTHDHDKTDPSGRATNLWHIDCIDIQLLRLSLWRPDAAFSIQLSKAAHARLGVLYEKLANSNNDRQAALSMMPPPQKKGVDFEFPIELLEYFKNKFTGTNKTYDDINVALVWLRNEIISGNTQHMCPMEFLINDIRPGEQVNDPAENYQRWEAHKKGELFDQAKMYVPGQDSNEPVPDSMANQQYEGDGDGDTEMSDST